MSRPPRPATALALPGLRGELLRPADDGYDGARQVFNGMIDRRPALIARCAGADDLAAVVDLAREQHLPPGPARRRRNADAEPPLARRSGRRPRGRDETAFGRRRVEK